MASGPWTAEGRSTGTGWRTKSPSHLADSYYTRFPFPRESLGAYSPAAFATSTCLLPEKIKAIPFLPVSKSEESDCNRKNRNGLWSHRHHHDPMRRHRRREFPRELSQILALPQVAHRSTDGVGIAEILPTGGNLLFASAAIQQHYRTAPVL